MSTGKQPKHKRYISVDAVQENLEKLSKIKAWVANTYQQHTTGWTWERSEGNCADCFYDGQECGRSWAAWEVGKILGIDLEEPDWEEEDE